MTWPLAIVIVALVAGAVIVVWITRSEWRRVRFGVFIERNGDAPTDDRAA